MSPADLSGEPWIGVPQGLPFDRILLDIEQAVGAPARVVQRFSDTRITESLVASGHGIALTGMAGRLVADTIAGQAERFDLFARLRHRNFPGGRALRMPALVLAMLWFRLKDLL